MNRINFMHLALIVTSVCCMQTACDEKKPSPTPTAASASVSTAVASVVPSATLAPSVTAAPAASDTKPPAAITAQHVLVAYKGAKGADKTITRSKADAKKRADEVATKAKAAGADFTALVMEYSDDPGSKARSGSLGKFTPDKMTKPFSDAAFALRVDETSTVIETDFGFHIIKRNQ
jgi:NIMA-interacting peptidyl-prolyl cis-trans isomerase 1